MTMRTSVAGLGFAMCLLLIADECALAQVQTAQPGKERIKDGPAASVAAGDSLRVITKDARLMAGERVVAKLQKGELLVAEKVVGPWILTSHKTGGRTLQGWVHRRDVDVNKSVTVKKTSRNAPKRSNWSTIQRPKEVQPEVFTRVKRQMDSSAEQEGKPVGTSILEIHLPENAEVLVDGKNYGAEQKFVFDWNGTEEPYQLHHVVVRNVRGWIAERTILLKKGWHVRLPLSRTSRQIDLEFTLPPILSDVSAVAFSGNGKLIAIGNERGRTVILESETGRLVSRLDKHRLAVYALAFDPDASNIVTGSHDRTVALCDVKTGKRIRTFKGHNTGLKVAAFSPDGKLLATGSWSETIVWKVATGELIREFPSRSEAIVFSTDGRLAVANAAKVIVWDPTSAKEPVELELQAKAVAFNSKGDVVSAASLDGIISWNLKTLETKRRQDLRISPSRGAKFGPNLKSLLTIQEQSAAYLYDLETGAKSTIHAMVSRSGQLAFSPDGRFVLLGGYSTIFLVDVEKGTIVSL